uniref:Histone-lysine N-methyltransferase n=1 Tax=Caenorhabditis tropicalis TaxID=1561998 RepID=A0A1I7V3S4_9PELO
MAPQNRSGKSTLKVSRCRFEHRQLTLRDEVALIFIKQRKHLFMKNEQPKRDQYEEMKMEIEKSAEEYGYNSKFEADYLMELAENSKAALKNMMNRLIVKKRMNKKKMEEELRKWSNYDGTKFFRKCLEEDEMRMWEEQEQIDEMEVPPEGESADEEENMEEEKEEVDENMPPSEEDKEDLNGEEIDSKTDEKTFPEEIALEEEGEPINYVAIVINQTNEQVPQANNVKIVPKLPQKVPFACAQSIFALQQGTVIFPNYPGVPNKKFEAKDLMNFGTMPIQTVFEDREKPGHWTVLFEAVNDRFGISEELLKQFAPEALNKAKTMVKFFESLEAGALGNDFRFGSTPLFRHFQDVSFIHSKIHEKFGMGSVTYMACDPSQAPPLYQNTPVNLMKADVYKACMTRRENKPFVMKGDLLVAIPKGCENPDGCMCNEKFEAHYKKRCNQNLEPNSEGLLDLSGLDVTIMRILIECSDDCGCSFNCPRRQVQRRKTPPTVVFHDGDIGYTLRALEKIVPGQFIGEYTGLLKVPKVKDDHSYEASVRVMNPNLVICAREAGSVVRFMSHSCDPSAVFIVTHSREKETDLLIPRLAVFALKEINIGDPITIKYYNKKDLKGVKRSIKCLCGSSNCIGYLPG